MRPVGESRARSLEPRSTRAVGDAGGEPPSSRVSDTVTVLCAGVQTARSSAGLAGFAGRYGPPSWWRAPWRCSGPLASPPRGPPARRDSPRWTSRTPIGVTSSRPRGPSACSHGRTTTTRSATPAPTPGRRVAVKLDSTPAERERGPHRPLRDQHERRLQPRLDDRPPGPRARQPRGFRADRRGADHRHGALVRPRTSRSS